MPAGANQILVVRSLRESDLGLFAAHRAAETSRQRAINLNSDIIQELLSDDVVEAGQVTLPVIIRFGEDEFEDDRLIKRTQKNWRLGGNKIENKGFADLDADDFLLLRSRPKNDGSSPIFISFIARKHDRVIHAGIGAIVDRKLRGSMALLRSSDPHYSSLLRYCVPKDDMLDLELIPEPEEPVQPQLLTVAEKVRSPSIMERMFRMAGELSGPAQLRYVETVVELAEQMRAILLETGRIVKLDTGHSNFWPQVSGLPLGFVDGGLANLTMLGSAPIAARVGGYVVVPGQDDGEREDFIMLQELIDDLFVHQSGGVYDSLFPDYGALRDAARIAIEAAGAVRLLAKRNDLAIVMLHGALVNPVSRYSDLMSEGQIRAAFPSFSQKAVSEFLPDTQHGLSGRDAQFINVYLRQLEVLQSSDAILCGVVEREGTTSTVSSTVLNSFREEEIRHLLPIPFEDWRSWYRERLLPEADEDEGQRITDSLLFRCVLREGEAISPVEIDRNELRRAPRAWEREVSRYPRPNVSFVQVSEWSAPVRIEMFERDLDDFKYVAELVYHSSRLLPKYAFPAGLDIVDKFAKVPNWMTKQVSTRAAVRALSLALQEGDHRSFDNLRRVLCGTGREWMMRPTHLR